ncbi:KaiC domain-containing protein [Haloglomus litoreum]|uniref:KaiC domain-containing protein n=1 Tax=Haloglomus litoreum TaxID=3034026 RepID=UPI0023E8EA4E|nr:KaiC domain-containing protein [Haloglomus sp. DT116]
MSDEGDDDWFEGGLDEDASFDEGGAPDAGGMGGGPPGEEGEELFEEDFASAFEGGGSSSGFDEEFESNLPRVDLGITGLDEMIQGGVPERSLLVVIGSAGTGKTTFGLQFLQKGLEEGERTVYITLEESREAIVEAATEKGWPFDEYLEDDQLAIIDLDPVEMANSLASIRSDLPRLIDDFDAERLVLDSVSLLEMMYDNQPDRRTEVFDFTKALKSAGVTTMVTSEADQDNPYASRHGIIEYLTDGVFVLQYVRSEFRETRLAVEIQKIRNANHSRETKPYEITGEGISVYQQANIF